MNIAYLNGQYLPIEQAKISPLDRGFLFGDGVYEVVPSYEGKLVGFLPHLQRMNKGLEAIGISTGWSENQWLDLCLKLIQQNGAGNLGIYLQISRGTYDTRAHRFPDKVNPTIFAFCFEIPPAPVADKSLAKTYTVSTARDIRWDRRDIKSTSLLGNVLHYQQGVEQGNQETLLFNDHNELTEASSCNAFIVKNGSVITPPLDHQKLPGITRQILIDILRNDGNISVEERAVTMDEVAEADEVWITSSSREIAPVIAIDSVPVGDGQVGDVWLAAQTLFSANRFNY
ncbi:D-amino acid aminotransferase [Porticoccaceae bacterium]|jgi:D-alanine transaminase|nr:D-amino acid aminotransferase [Porticoccaceae bacterium]